MVVKDTSFVKQAYVNNEEAQDISQRVNIFSCILIVHFIVSYLNKALVRREEEI